MNREREQFPPPNEPLRVARQLEPEWRENGLLALRHWRGQWMQWRQIHWAEVDAKDIRSWAWTRLESAYFVVMKDGRPEEKPWAPNRTKIGDLLEAMSAVKHLSTDVDAPSWLDNHENSGRSPIVACTNGLLDLRSRELLPLTPGHFNLVSVPFDYDANAVEPKAWLEFLDQLWGDDPDQISALQEWFGYVLSGRTDQQKIMLVVGPTRSGKGTVARVMAALIGKGNVAGPTLASLGTNFGLSPLLGKPLAIVSDARLGGRDTHLVTERLLTVSGEDLITIDRKYRDPWSGKLPTRVMILSNELPSFGDASGVIAHRFVALSLIRSWLGKEDTTLTQKLTAELPGILNWALEGLDRLDRRGSFTQPAASIEAIVMMQDQASPVSAFVRDRCVVGPGYEVEVEVLWRQWREWCQDNGRGEKGAGTKQLFGKNLRSVAPTIRLIRPREGDERPRVYQGVKLRGVADNGPLNRDPFVQNGIEDDEGGPRRSTQTAHIYRGTRAHTHEEAQPAMANYADHRGPEGACPDPSHTPRQRSGRWICDECDPPEPTLNLDAGPRFVDAAIDPLEEQ